MKRIVKIKTWKQMEEEYYKSDNREMISVGNFHFSKEMEEKLPKNRIITIIRSKINVWKWGNYTITNNMIKKELNPEKYPEYLL